MGRAETGQMYPLSRAAGEAGDGARRGRQPQTPMAVFSFPASDPQAGGLFGTTETFWGPCDARHFSPSTPFMGT